jgi:hypothetical protein
MDSCSVEAWRGENVSSFGSYMGSSNSDEIKTSSDSDYPMRG